jgi:hypothetical protein
VQSLSLFFNKGLNLCYGMFLKQLNDFEIIAYKEPSTIREVDFKRIVEELYEAKY